jgi:MerR family transcriptional regulator/heat shock protein HspR
MAEDRLFDKPLYVISVVAELTAMHPQTLRTYERRGLLRPRRLANNRRLYSQHDLERLQRIQQLTDTGLNLAGVERVLALEESLAGLQAEMERLRRRLTEATQRTQDEVRRVEREHRRDLVPVERQTAVVAFRRPVRREEG